MLSEGIDWLAGQLKDHASTAVTYKRGTFSRTIQATLGRHAMKSLGGMPDNEVDTALTVMTFDAADLVLGGQLTEPARGDTISYRSHGVIFTFMILPMDGERWWKESDAFGKRLEVHLKLQSRE